MGSLAMHSALMVVASAVLGALGERLILSFEDDAYRAANHGLHRASLRDGSGNWTPQEPRSFDRAMASFIQLRRAERHAAAACIPGQEYPQQTFMGTNSQAFKINARTCLNSGAFGDVYSTEFAGAPVALKQQDITDAAYDGLYVFRAEAKNHNKWAMDGFVQMKASFETEDWGFMYLEMADRGDLGALKRAGGRLKVQHSGGATGKGEITLPELMADMVSPLLAMHEEGWAHRDLKLGNVLMFQGSDRVYAKLADLGMACQVARKGRDEGTVKYDTPDESKVRADDGYVNRFWPRCTYVGKCGGVWKYMPPEHLQHTLQTAGQEACTQRFTRKSDVWMLGVMVAELAGFRPPKWGLGWAMYAAEEQLGRRIESSEVEQFDSEDDTDYQDAAKMPTGYPAEKQLDQVEAHWRAKGCLRALLKGMLKPEGDRLEMLQVSELVMKWVQGTAC